MPYLDAHCHFAAEPMASHLDATMAWLAGHGIAGGLQGGVDPADWERQAAQSRAYPGRLFRAAGIHPWTVDATDEAGLQAMLDALPAALAGAAALGEIGLDHARAKTPEARAKQERWCEAQWRVSEDAQVPVVWHVVRAHGALDALWRRGGWRPRPGLIHSFTGSRETARAWVDRGLLLSFGPRSLAPAMADVARALPWDAIVIESDAPFTRRPAGAARRPHPWGEITLPDVILDVAAVVGAWRGVTADEVLAHSTRNLRRVFPALKET